MSTLTHRALIVGISTFCAASFVMPCAADDKPPLERVCHFCHTEYPNLCDEVTCQPGSKGCTGRTGTLPDGRPFVTAECVYNA